MIFNRWSSEWHRNQACRPIHMNGGINLPYDQGINYLFIDEQRARQEWRNAPLPGQY